MKLITEKIDSVKFITESTKEGKKNLYIEGIFLQSNVKNRNGRMYPESVMDKEVTRYIKESVDTKRAYGELSHPDSPSINLDRVSHLITSLRKEGTNYIGKAKILETPMGNIAKGLLEGGANLGISSRALGSLKMNSEGINVVQDDFMLASAGDLVSDPSGPECFVQGIMEGVSWVYIDGRYEQQNIENTQKAIRNASSGKLNEVSIQAFQNFLTSIK